MEGFFDQIRGPAGQVFRGLYGAPDDPRLSPEQNQAGLGRGLTQGGLAMMLAGGQGQDFLSVLAQGMLASQQGVAQFQQSQLATQNQMELARMAQGPVTPENLGRMMMSAIGAGNIDAARTISEVLKSQMAIGGRTGANRPRFVKRTIDGQHYEIALDPFTGEELYRTQTDFPVSAYSVRGDVPTAEGRYVDSTGTGRLNKVTGEIEPVYQNVDRPRSEAEGRAESFITPLQVNLPIIDEFDENPLPFEGEIYRNWIAGNVSSDRARRLYGAAIPIGEAWLRQTTGAAYNDTEYANSALIFIPRAGDSSKVREQKREMRSALMIMTKRRAGVPLTPSEEAFEQSVASRYEAHMAQAARAYAGVLDRGGSSEEAVEAGRKALGLEEGGSGPGGIRGFARNRSQQDTIPPGGLF